MGGVKSSKGKAVASPLNKGNRTVLYVTVPYTDDKAPNIGN